MYRIVLAFHVVICSTIVVGCSGPKSNRPETVPVSGFATHNGQPIEGATVMFFPEVPPGNGAGALTDSSGKFLLSTFESGDGVVPGSYLVTVMKTRIEANPKAKIDPNEPPEVHINILPERYTIPTRSGFKAEVTKGEKNEFTFELKD